MTMRSDLEIIESLSPVVGIWERYKKDSTVSEHSPIAFDVMNEAHRDIYGHYHPTHCNTCFRNLMKIVMQWYDDTKALMPEPKPKPNFNGLKHKKKK